MLIAFQASRVSHISIVYGAVNHNCVYSLILFFLGNPDTKLETDF
jgi:hypothetical protein